MQEIISKCGNICTDCPWSAFARQKIKPEDWEAYSKQIKKYIGYKPAKYEWEGCLGCHTPDEDFPKHPHYGFLKGCRTRKCVIHNEIKTCAHCNRFSCGNTVTTDAYSKEKMTEKLGDTISNGEYKQYIRMFDSMTHLQELRSGFDEDEIKEPKVIVADMHLEKFPEKMKSQNQYYDLYCTLRSIIASDFHLTNIDTIAGNVRAQERRQFILRLLWILGLFGEMLDQNRIKIDSVTLHEHKKPMKIPSNEKNWQVYFDILKDLGMDMQLDILTNQIYTPGGWMREKIPKTNDPAYYLIIDLDTKRVMPEFFITLQKYVKTLDKSYKRGAFSQFSKLNMSKLVSFDD
ncbi:MAG: DUF3795 domain-containing protein [Candidatus Kariarchaeaceae archaeon]